MTPTMSQLFLAVVSGIALAVSGNGYAMDNTALVLSSHAQLFLDDFLVDSMENLQRTIVTPEKHPANPLIVQDKPWESRFLEIYGTVLYEEDSGRFRCWYLGSEHNGSPPDTPEHPKTAEYVTCYAESSNGIAWSKPFIGPRPYGSRNNHNILIEGTHGFCVLPEPDDPDPRKKYKGVGGPLWGYSPDGIHWETHDWRPAVGKNDTSSCVVHWEGEYLAYVRAQVSDPAWPGVMRGIGLTTSRDFDTWTPKTAIFTTDKQDGYPWTQPYGISVTPYGDVLIGIMWMLHLDRIEGNNSTGEQDTQLVVSRDGKTWHRVANCGVFLAPTPDSWDQGGVFPGTTMFSKDNHIYIYYTGRTGRHGESSSAMGIGLATVPADRFVALRQAESSQPGILVTRPMALSNADLIVNADLANGDLAVELLDSDGTPFTGFSGAQSQLVPVDPLRYRVVWTSEGRTRALKDANATSAIALRFVLRGSALYALQTP